MHGSMDSLTCITYAVIFVYYTPVYIKFLFLADGDYAHIKY